MKKLRNLKIASIVLIFLFLIELAPTISLRSMRDEVPLRTIPTEYITIDGIVENYYYYNTEIKILLDSDNNLETNWFYTIYYMKDEYQDTKIYDDIYEGMPITIIYYPEVEGYIGNEHYEIAGMYADEKTYISLTGYIELEEDDYKMLIDSSETHLAIDIIFLISATTTMVIHKRLKKKLGVKNEENNY